DVKLKTVQAKIGAVAVGNVDPVNLQTQRHEPIEPLYGYSEIRTAHALGDVPLQPRLPRSSLQQAKRREENHDEQTERNAQPAKQSCHDAYQKACPRLM